MKYIYHIIALCLLTSLFFASCDNFEGEQEIPSYIEFKGFKVVENPQFNYEQQEGFLTSDITDVWVFVDGKNLGMYSLPKDSSGVRIPILKEGRHTIDLEPGVKYNGMAATRDYYRFYTYYTEQVDLKPGQVIDMGVKEVMYNKDRSDISFYYLFENGLSPFESIVSDTTDRNKYFSIIGNDSVKYGNNCLAMYSTTSKDEYKILSKDSVVCSNTNAMILEIDYHSNIPFEVGIYGRISSTTTRQVYVSAMRLKENDAIGWRKMYIILGKVWSQISYQPFKIYFQPFNTKNITNGYIHIDNIKVIHFPE